MKISNKRINNAITKLVNGYKVTHYVRLYDLTYETMYYI